MTTDGWRCKGGGILKVYDLVFKTRFCGNLQYVGLYRAECHSCGWHGEMLPRRELAERELVAFHQVNGMP